MSPRRTVLHVINTDGPGGAETVCINLVRGLDASRWRPVVVLPADGCGWLGGVLADAGVETVPLLDTSRAAVPGYLRGLSRTFDRYDVDVVHSHLFGPSILAGLAGRARGVPVVATVHGQGDLSPNERLRWLKFRLLGFGASRIVFVSEALRQHFLESGPLPRSRTLVIPNGIQLAEYGRPDREARRSELGIAADEFLVGAVGNIRTSKGYDVFLRAAAILKSGARGYRFVIAGEANDGLIDSLTSLRDELGLREDVSFLGFRADVPAVLSSLDLFALTSRMEGFSISLIEAMASRLPVVATRCGGPEHIVEHGMTGVLVDNGSAEQVAQAIASLRNDGARRRLLGEAARAEVELRYGVEAQVSAYETLYQRAIEETHPARRPAPTANVGSEATR